MRILFVANTVQNLYKQIEKEMTHQGHDVHVVEDEKYRFDPNQTLPVPKYISRVLWTRFIKRKWELFFESVSQLHFDLLFILSGYSVNDYVINRLKEINPNIKIVLYTWDSTRYYRFDRHFSYCDYAYTFDYADAKEDKRWKLLPIFHGGTDSNNVTSTIEHLYDISIIGSNHDGRYTFIKKILPALKSNKIRYYIKIVSEPRSLSIPRKIRLLFTNTTDRNEIIDEINFSQGKENVDLLERHSIDFDVYQSVINSSRCILDDQRHGQSGLTARFIWALSKNKKILTTNTYSLNYSFVNPKQVCIIDKANPIIPLDFLVSDLTPSELSDVKDLCINNWVKTVLTI